MCFFFFQAEDGIRGADVTGVQTCALPISGRGPAARGGPAVMIPLRVLEEVIDRSGVAPRIEPLLPIGVRARQLLVRTLLLGMLLVLADHRPAHLTRVRQALAHLPEADQRRLGVLADWKTGPHR